MNNLKILLQEQRNEITSHIIYKMLSEKVKNQHNSEILKRISGDEIKHYNFLKEKTGQDVKPSYIKSIIFYFMSLIFGLTFGMKLLENGEINAQRGYDELKTDYKEVELFLQDEEQHEKELINMINEEKLNYISSIVLGLNDALVELTGALAGYTFAFGNTKIIALAGLITGISASFSMAASEYLSSSHEGNKNALKSSIYTGIAYILTVIALTLPYLLIANPFISLGVMLAIVIVIIAVFNYYVAIVKDEPFKNRFWQMTGISLGVAGLSFAVGVIIKNVLGINI